MRVITWFGARLAPLGLVLAVVGCAQPEIPHRVPQLTIQLRWVQGYPRETTSKVETGLKWALSFMGATLAADSQPFSWHGNTVTIDLDAAGVMPATKPAWIAVLNTLKASEEYRRMGALDIGRFLMLTLCSSHQYYALTGAPRTFGGFQQRHPQSWQPAAVVESAIAHGNRLLHIGQGTHVEDMYFVAYEGSGAIADNSFSKTDIETIDFMPNGQLRFGIYDSQGNPTMATSSELTAAGKPSKCLWCHEIRLQDPFKNRTSVPGYYSAQELRDVIRNRMTTVDKYRETLDSQIDFRRTGDHTFAELLYLSFAEPSAARLALEWGMPEAQVTARLRGLQTHRQKEFAYLGEALYDRGDVDRFAPYPTIQVPSDVREPSAYEPDLLPSEPHP